MDQVGTWHGGGPWSRLHYAIWRRSSPPKKGAEPPPQFSVHFYCGQTVRRIKMPLGMEAGLIVGDFVRWGPSPFPKRAEPPIFGPCLLRPNGWMYQDAIWYGGRPQPRRLCVRWDPVPSPILGPCPLWRKRLNRSRWHLAWRWALVQATLC